jgi:hypothetical protein
MDDFVIIIDDGAGLSLSSCTCKLQLCQLLTLAAVSGLTDSNMKTKFHYYHPVYHNEFDKLMFPPPIFPLSCSYP